MSRRIPIEWNNISGLTSRKYVCGYCGEDISSMIGYSGKYNSYNPVAAPHIYICHHCSCPTFIDGSNIQYPHPRLAKKIKHITDTLVEGLFEEAGNCLSFSAYTSCVACCRKLLMNIAVSKGANEGLTFAKYIDYLNDKNYIPPDGKPWVNKIRELGNEANHKIEMRTEKEAKLIMKFTEVLLTHIYEVPGMLSEFENL